MAGCFCVSAHVYVCVRTYMCECIYVCMCMRAYLNSHTAACHTLQCVSFLHLHSFDFITFHCLSVSITIVYFVYVFIAIHRPCFLSSSVFRQRVGRSEPFTLMVDRSHINAHWRIYSSCDTINSLIISIQLI